MPLNEDDVREILRLIDESDLAELRIETGELSLHVVRGDAPEPEPARALVDAAADGLLAIADMGDTTTRDGNRSLWSATGPTTPDVLAIAPTMNRVGCQAVDFTSSTHMAVSVRFHQEDPWERIRLVSAAMPATPLSFITS